MKRIREKGSMKGYREKTGKKECTSKTTKLEQDKQKMNAQIEKVKTASKRTCSRKVDKLEGK